MDDVIHNEALACLLTLQNNANIRPTHTRIAIVTDILSMASCNEISNMTEVMTEMMPAIFTVIVGSAFMTLIVKSMTEDAINK
ncbi:MAG: hypothetical protein CL861_03760 [Cyanobium sp. MED843]|nr:hypothetical protein [Cyanobium sp. MED843]OUW29259.1 MAG: hypothetical protein CBD37_03525 [Cyanobacteria bacterium TMED177]